MSPGARIAEELWSSGPGGTRVFERVDVERLPAPARLYMEHAIAPGTPLANAVRLRLRGEIKLRRWLPFTAEQVVHRVRGFIWRASAQMNGLAIRGFDRLASPCPAASVPAGISVPSVSNATANFFARRSRKQSIGKEYR